MEISAKKYYFIRGIIWFLVIVAIVLVLAYFFQKNYGILGQVTYQKNFTSFGNISEVSTPLYSADRNYRRISTPDVYFDAVLPRGASQVNFEVNLENLDQDLVYLTLEKNNSSNNIYNQSQLIHSAKLDNLSTDEWNQQVVAEDGVVWWQNKSAKQYEQLADLLADLANIQKVVYSGFEESDLYLFKDYQPALEETILKYPFRGGLQFLTYASEEEIYFDLTFEDKNTNGAVHSVKLILLKDGEEISRAVADNTQQAGSQHVSIRYPQDKIITGTYYLKVEAADNIFFSEIKTQQHVLALTSRFKLAEGGEPLVGYLSTDELVLTPIHATGEQTISLDSQKKVLAAADKSYDFEVEKKFAKLIIPKNDVVLDFIGLLILNEYSQALFADKNLIQLKDVADLDEFNYIITKYNLQDTQANLYQAIFDLENVFVRNGRFVRFHLYFPGWQIGDWGINLRNIKITYDTQGIF